MYQHILIATDESELSTRAVEHGVALACAVGARVSFLTITEAFHVFTLDAGQIEDTRLEFVEHMKARAEHTLAARDLWMSLEPSAFAILRYPNRRSSERESGRPWAGCGRWSKS